MPHTIYFEIEPLIFLSLPAFYLYRFDLALDRLLFGTAIQTC